MSSARIRPSSGAPLGILRTPPAAADPRGTRSELAPAAVGEARELAPSSALETVLPRSHSEGDGATAGSGFDAFVHHPATRAAFVGLAGFSALAGTASAATAADASPVRAEAPQDARATAKYRGIVYVGMNETSSYEVEALRGKVGYNGVKYISPSKVQDTVELKGVTYDLGTPEGRSGFVAGLGITGDRAAALESLLQSQGADGRDELAKLVIVYDQAERGDRYIERLVFSGHSVGSGVWGDGNGSLNWSNLQKLSLVFPKAAGQVQDLALAACYSGGESTMDKYREMFPNVKTIWAYDGSAPGAVSGAIPHLTRWERATRGDQTDKLARGLAEHTRKGENVAVWTVSKGYDNGEVAAPLASVMAQYDNTKTEVAQYFSGEKVIESPYGNSLRTHYNNIQRLLGRGDLAADQRASLEGERDQTIRLLYFKNVSGFFQAVHGGDVQSAFAELGLEAPDFSKLSRAEAMAKIAEFEAKYGEKDSPSSNLDYVHGLLTEGLRDLSASRIPEAWV